MGWNDHDPHFTAIENIMNEDDIEYMEAYEIYIDMLRDAAMDQAWKS
jgi:hypothetical protein